MKAIVQNAYGPADVLKSYLGAGHARGKVVIIVKADTTSKTPGASSNEPASSPDSR